ncbi:hypothetical protein L9F63_026858, partial [Diploptera punctata]
WLCSLPLVPCLRTIPAKSNAEGFVTPTRCSCDSVTSVSPPILVLTRKFVCWYVLHTALHI